MPWWPECEGTSVYPLYNARVVHVDELSEEDWQAALDQFEQEWRDPATWRAANACYADARKQLFTYNLGEIHRDPPSQSPLPLTEDETL